MIEALRDCAADERGTLLVEQVDQALLLRDEVVDLGCFAIKQIDDTFLFLLRW